MTTFWKRIFDPQYSLLRYVVGTAALTMVIQFFYDLVMASYAFLGVAVLVAVLFIVVVLIVVIDYRSKLQRQSARPTEGAVTPHKGLILLVSPKKAGLPIETQLPLISIRPHLGRLQTCWLLHTKDSAGFAAELAEHLQRTYGLIVKADAEYRVDPESIRETWALVDSIYRQKGPAMQLAEEDVIADITGGTKPMTGGMALACFAAERDMQYIETPRDTEGNPIPGAERKAILISTLPIHLAETPDG
jgi:hypothetical protein